MLGSCSSLCLFPLFVDKFLWFFFFFTFLCVPTLLLQELGSFITRQFGLHWIIGRVMELREGRRRGSRGGGGREVKRRLMGELTEKLLVFRVVTGRLIVAGVVMTFRHVFQCSS